MFKTLKSLFRAQTERPEPAPSEATFAAGLPLGMAPELFEGLRLDGRVRVRLASLAAYSDTLFAWDSDSYRHIAAVGHVDLGQGSHLVRFYLDNDTWIQANVEHQQILEYKLFDFYRVAHLSDVEFDQLINAGDKKTDQPGAQTLTLEATDGSARRPSYQRVWGDAASLWSPPVVLEEEVTTTERIVPRHVTHHAMLYERPIEGSERMEYVLVSAEDDGEGGFMRVDNLGVDIASVDIDAV